MILLTCLSVAIGKYPQCEIIASIADSDSAAPALFGVAGNVGALIPGLERGKILGQEADMTTEANYTDRYGLPLTTNSQTALAHYAEGLELALSQNFGAEEAFARATEADEGFALAHASRAFMEFLRIAVPDARASAEQAVKLSSGLSSRERGYVDVVSKFVNGQNHAASAAVHEHLKEFPLDSLLLRLAQRLYTQGCVGIGAPDYPPRFYKLMTEAAPYYGEDWAFMGQYAWANHEVGKMAEGMDLAERSLNLNPSNGVAAHSVAHVFYEMSQDDEGAAFLAGWLEDYDRRSTYRVHLSWHQALFELALGRYNQALGWYDRDIRPSVQGLKYAALADSASLIWRMKIYGDTAPQAPWSELVELAAPAAARPGPSFRDAHAALAFTAAEDDESFGKLVDGLQAMADGGDATAREATLPLVKGIGAFGRGEYAEAVRLMEPVYPQLTRVGGSHAQRLVFEDTLLEAYLRAEEFDKATGMLRERLSRRESPRELYWLARAQAGQGQQAEARNNAAHVKETWGQADTNTPEYGRLTQLAAD